MVVACSINQSGALLPVKSKDARIGAMLDRFFEIIPTHQTYPCDVENFVADDNIVLPFQCFGNEFKSFQCCFFIFRKYSIG